MSNIRIKFYKKEQVKYISHLDTVKVFDRALRRLKLQLVYSKGYNPHPNLVFGLPLAIGVTSQAEYADLEFFEDIDCQTLISQLNSQLPNGIFIENAKDKMTKDNIMSTLNSAKYDVLIKTDHCIETFIEKFKKFKDLPDIFVDKKTKKNTVCLNIRPLIYQIDVFNLEKAIANQNIYIDEWIKLKHEYNENLVVISMFIKAGSIDNLKPQLVIEALKNFLSLEIDIIKVHRMELLVTKENIDPLSYIALGVDAGE